MKGVYSKIWCQHRRVRFFAIPTSIKRVDRGEDMPVQSHRHGTRLH
jgi:hypothetical protein